VSIRPASIARHLLRRVSVEGTGALARQVGRRCCTLLADADARPAIVYCGTRKDTDDLAGRLRAEAIRDGRYHAGMSPDARRASQSAFMEDRARWSWRRTPSHGVDKAAGAHGRPLALPTSLEAYYQEAAGAGATGARRARCCSRRAWTWAADQVHQERETSWRTSGATLPAASASRRRGGDVGHGELGERDRVLLSIAERAGALELEPAGHDGLLVRLTGRGSPRKAHDAIRARRTAAGTPTARSSQ